MRNALLKDIRFENGVLRHADGSIDIAAYGSIARGERTAALHSAVRAAYRFVAAAVAAMAGEWRDAKPTIGKVSLT